MNRVNTVRLILWCGAKPPFNPKWTICLQVMALICIIVLLNFGLVATYFTDMMGAPIVRMATLYASSGMLLPQ